MSSLLNRTTLAATRFFDGNGLHLRVYYQYTSDNVKESFWDKGWNLRGDGSVVNAKLNSPITVVSWASGTQIRVYYLDNDNYVCERAYEGGATWVDGSLRTYKFQAAPFSQLASSIAADKNSLKIRVYFQATDGHLQELQFNANWQKSTRNLPQADLGSALSAMGGLESAPDEWWLYYQDPTLKMKEVLCSSSTAPWNQGAYSVPGVFRPGAAVSAIGWGSASQTNVNHIRVYVINEKNEVIESAWEQGWNNGTLITKPTVTDSGVAAIQWKENNLIEIRVYFQRGQGIKEWVYNGHQWVEGANVPIYP